MPVKKAECRLPSVGQHHGGLKHRRAAASAARSEVQAAVAKGARSLPRPAASPEHGPPMSTQRRRARPRRSAASTARQKGPPIHWALSRAPAADLPQGRVRPVVRRRGACCCRTRVTAPRRGHCRGGRHSRGEPYSFPQYCTCDAGRGPSMKTRDGCPTGIFGSGRRRRRPLRFVRPPQRAPVPASDRSHHSIPASLPPTMSRGLWTFRDGPCALADVPIRSRIGVTSPRCR